MMIVKCANPICNEPFNYKEGRLFFVHVSGLTGTSRRNSHGVQHFWLCSMCCEARVVEIHKKWAKGPTEASQQLAESFLSHTEALTGQLSRP